jgi:hypothetical protein
MPCIDFNTAAMNTRLEQVYIYIYIYMTRMGSPATSAPLRTRTQMVLETLVFSSLNLLTRLVAWEDFIISHEANLSEGIKIPSTRHVLTSKWVHVWQVALCHFCTGFYIKIIENFHILKQIRVRIGCICAPFERKFCFRNQTKNYSFFFYVSAIIYTT